MSRRIWIILAVVLVAMVVLAAGAGGALLLRRQYQERKWHRQAEEAFERGEWRIARTYYEWYLSRQGRDTEALDRYAQANLNMVDGRVDALRRAAMAYNQIRQHDPEREDIKDKLMELQMKLGSWGDVLYFSDLFLATRPDDADLLHYRAVATDRGGRRDAAITEYRRLIDNGVARAEIYGNLAALLRQRDLHQQAQEVLDQAVEKRPDDPEVYLVRAAALLERRDLAGAEAEVARAAELAPDNMDVRVFQVRMALQRRDWDTVIAQGTALIEEDPAQSDVRLAVSHAYRSKGDNAASLRTLLEVDPLIRADAPQLFLSLAELQITDDLIDDARRTIEEYKRSYPAHRTVTDYLEARVMLATGDADGAARRLAIVVEQNPDLTAAQFFLAMAHLRTGNRVMARSHLESYLRRNPADENARIVLERETGAEQTPEELVAAAEGLLAQSDARPVALVSAAFTLFESALRQGSAARYVDLASRLFERAIDIEPRTPSAYVGLADVRTAVGNTAGAREALARGLAAGIEEQRLLRAFANVSAEEGDIEAARGYFDRMLAGDDATVDAVVEWAEFFARRGHLDVALGCLDAGAARLDTPESRARLAAQRVEAAMAAGDGERAFALLADAEAQTSGVATAVEKLDAAKITLVEWLLDQGGSDAAGRAEQVLQGVLTRAPEDPRALAAQGRALTLRVPPDLDRAAAVFESVLRRDSANVQALTGMGYIAASRGEMTKALEYAGRAVSFAPRATGLQLWRAELLVRMQRHLEAEQVLQSLLAREPRNAAAVELLINSYAATNQQQKADEVLTRFEQQVGDDPAWADALRGLRGKVVMAAGLDENAVRVLREQYEAQPDDFHAVRRLAFALLGQGRAQEAEPIVKEYVAAHESDPGAFVMLAQFYLGTRDPSRLDDASGALTRALLIDGNSVPALREMVEVQARKGNMPGLLAACDRYLTLNPEDAHVHYIKASFLRSDPSRLGDALEAANRAATLERRPDYVGLRGIIYLERKDYARALEDLRAVSAEVVETSAEVDAALAEAYLGVGETDLARSFYESAKRKAEQEGIPAPRRLEQVGASL